MKAPRLARRIAFVVPPGGEILDITGPMGAFAAANRVRRTAFGQPDSAYVLETIGPAVGAVELVEGVRLYADRAWGRVRDDVDTLFIPGAADVAPMLDRQVQSWVRRMAANVRRVVSVCTGALVLAEAGLLEGRRATTHWESCPRLARHPGVTVVPDAIFVRDGNVWTSAGITAGIDLALALIEDDHGRDVALATARELVVFLQRPGGQSQFSTHLLAQSVGRERLHGGLDELVGWILDNLGGDLSVPALSARACTSPRHLTRLFNDTLETTPAAFVETARVEAARRDLETAGAALGVIARTTGFGSVERMRRAFVRRIGVLPSDYARRHEPVRVQRR